MDKKLISIKSGAENFAKSDRRCKRKDCVFPRPTIRFDLGDRRIIAVWSWTSVEVAGDVYRVKITTMPTLRLVPISHN